jgi:uncharacterized protein
VTLDDPLTRLAPQNDPVGLIRSYDRVAVDEIQRVPELYPSIKKAVDDDRRPGRFLLTGSANMISADCAVLPPAETASSTCAAIIRRVFQAPRQRTG